MHKDLITFYGDRVLQPMIQQKKNEREKPEIVFAMKLNSVKYKPPHRIEPGKPRSHEAKTSTQIVLITENTE